MNIKTFNFALKTSVPNHAEVLEDPVLEQDVHSVTASCEGAWLLELGKSAWYKTELKSGV